MYLISLGERAWVKDDFRVGMRKPEYLMVTRSIVYYQQHSLLFGVLLDLWNETLVEPIQK
jgi:hypothetical protein